MSKDVKLKKDPFLHGSNDVYDILYRGHSTLLVNTISHYPTNNVIITIYTFK